MTIMTKEIESTNMSSMKAEMSEQKEGAKGQFVNEIDLEDFKVSLTQVFHGDLKGIHISVSTKKGFHTTSQWIWNRVVEIDSIS